MISSKSSLPKSAQPSASAISSYSKSNWPVPSTRIIDGSSSTVTLSCLRMTSATVCPTWLFISVTPARLEDVRSVLNRSCVLLMISRLLRGCEADVGEQRGEALRRALQRLLEPHRLLCGLGPEGLQGARGLEADGRPLLQPLLQRRPVLGAEVRVGDQH